MVGRRHIRGDAIDLHVIREATKSIWNSHSLTKPPKLDTERETKRDAGRDTNRSQDKLSCR